MSSEITLTIDGVPTDFVRKDSIKSALPTGPESIIRTHSAGVHIGTVESVDGQIVVLKNARRLWKWSGAFTLHEVSTKGIARKDSRISCAVESITLLQAIEIIPVVSGVDLTSTEGE